MVCFASSLVIHPFASRNTLFVSGLKTPTRVALKSRRRTRIAPIAQQTADDEDPEEEEASDIVRETPGSRARRERRAAGKDARALIASLDATPDDFDDWFSQPDTEAAKAADKSPSLLLHSAFVVPSNIRSKWELDLDKPLNLLLASSISILFGFFAATALATVIVSVGELDIVWAALLLAWTEGFTRWYYSREEAPGRLLQLVNAFKIGVIFGMTVDAFKLST